MSTTIVLFEDVDPFDTLNFPITFRAVIDFATVDRWEVDSLEAQGARGGWVEVGRDHALWPVFEAYIRLPAGRERIEREVAEAAASDAVWRDARPSYHHAAE